MTATAPAAAGTEAPFEVLLAALRAELAALDGDDAEAIETATTAKLAALAGLHALPTRAEVETAQALNALAAARVRTKAAGIERRLAALATAAGRGPALCYGRDGRTSL